MYLFVEEKLWKMVGLVDMKQLRLRLCAEIIRSKSGNSQEKTREDTENWNTKNN